MTATLHQTDELLELYALGRLPDSGSAALEEHLLVCELCQERLDEAGAFALAMRYAIANEPEHSARYSLFSKIRKFSGTGNRFIPLFASGLAAAAVLAILYLHPRPNVAPLASLELTAMRGNMVSVKPAQETDILLADAPSEPNTPVQIVDASGGMVWKGVPESANHRIRIMKQLAPGSYFVRLFDSSGGLLHEYGFQVQVP